MQEYLSINLENIIQRGNNLWLKNFLENGVELKVSICVNRMFYDKVCKVVVHDFEVFDVRKQMGPKYFLSVL